MQQRLCQRSSRQARPGSRKLRAGQVLVDERPDGVHLGYDKMANLLAPYVNAEALAVACGLDAKVEKLMRDAAAG
jgi:hypothetical protein